MSAALEIAAAVAAVPDRGPGTDAERRAALAAVEQIRRGGRRSAEIETFWCRPNWAMAQAWHTALGLAGSLVAVGSPKAGAGMLVAALLFVMADATFGISPGRRLTFEHASQNVVSSAPSQHGAAETRLIITANLDAGRQGLAHRQALRRPLARLRALADGRPPGWAAWLAIALVWALVTALLRVEGSRGTAVGVAQLIPTVGLVIALALLLDLAGAAWSPGANDNASGVGVVIALARALDAAPPAHAGVELVIAGAGDGQSIGLRRHLRRYRHTYGARNTIVLGIGPCGAGRPAWLRSDGPLIPLAYFRVLRDLCQTVTTLDPSLGLAELRGRGDSPALAARQAGLAAITLTALDDEALAPRSHRPDDTADRLDPAVMDAVLRAALLLVDEIDAYLARR